MPGMKFVSYGIAVCLLLPCCSLAQAPPGYYEDAATLNGYALKSKLNELISRKTISWNYGDLPAFYAITDRDYYYENDSTLLDIYSENPNGADPYNYYYELPNLISGASNEGEGWNREHVFSQSFFYSNYPMYSDLHFIVPTDARVNQRRSNYPYAEVGGNPSFESLNGSRVGTSAVPGYNLTVFEPIDAFKGDIARMLFYVAVRYEQLLPFFQWTNVRNPFQEKQEEALQPWLIPVLKQWHQQDPVSQKEIDRNNKVFFIQGNRNPFIDHPEWVDMIWNNDASDTIPPEAPVFLEVVGNGKYFLMLQWSVNPDDASLGFKVFRNDTLLGISRKPNFVCNGLDSNTSYTFSVQAYNHSYLHSAMSVPLTVSTLAADTFSRDLFFSKYIEGNENNHALEITNRTGYPVDLRHYYISIRQYNEEADALYWSNNQYQMEGVVENGRKLVLVHPGWDLNCFDKNDADFITAATPLNFDGWLALDLRKDSVTIDRIGNPYVYEAFAENISLYRKPGFNNPHPYFVANEWDIYPIDYCEQLGNLPVVDTTDTVSGIHPYESQTLVAYPNPLNNGRLYLDGANLSEIQEAFLWRHNGQLVRYWKYPFLHQPYLDFEGIVPGWYVLRLDRKVIRVVVL